MEIIRTKVYKSVLKEPVREELKILENNNFRNVTSYLSKGTMSPKNGGLANILFDLSKGNNISLIEVSENEKYSLEYITPIGETIIACIDRHSLRACKITAGAYMPLAGLTKLSSDEMKPLLVLILMRLLSDNNASGEKKMFEILLANMADPNFTELSEEGADIIHILSDLVNRGLEQEIINLEIKNGVIPHLQELVIASGSLSGIKIYGKDPTILDSKSSSTVILKKEYTIESLCEDPLVKQYREKQEKRLTEEERSLLINREEFSTDNVPKIVVEAIFLFLRTLNLGKACFRTFTWISETGVGKTTYCKMIAYILNKPYYSETMKADMVDQDLFDRYVPATGNKSVDYPKYFEIEIDPETSYYRLTGTYKKNVTPEDVLQAYGERKKMEAESAQYTLVQSDYVKGLTTPSGGVISINELTAAKPTVFTAANDMAEPGSKIKLSSGDSLTVNGESIVIFTDNPPEYAGRKALDPSVLRRSRIRRFIKIDTVKDKYMILNRVKANSLWEENDTLLNKMYDLWARIHDYRIRPQMEFRTGCCSIEELQNWATAVAVSGYTTESMDEFFEICVLNKVSDEIEERNEVYENVVIPFYA